jgi:hypothetical protein
VEYKGFVAAWLAGEAIIVWRIVHKDHRIPVPGALLGISALFAGMALVADIFPSAAKPVTLAAFGLDLAAFYSALPAGLSGQLNQSADVSKKLGA